MVLALPNLVLRAFQGFIESPAEWDGKIERAHWVNQFSQIAGLLLESLSSIPFSKPAWSCTFAIRVSNLAQAISEYGMSSCGLKDLFSKRQLYCLYSIIPHFQESKDDHLEDCSSSDDLFAFQKMSIHGQQVILKNLTELVSNSSFDIELFGWVFKHCTASSSQKFLEWILSAMIQDKAPLNHSIAEFLCTQLSKLKDNYSRQLARACSVLYVQETHSLKRKRETESPTSILTIEELVTKTPSPQYLLTRKQSGPESFKALQLDCILLSFMSKEK